MFQLKQESDVIGFYQFLFTNNQHMLIDIVYFVRVMDGYFFFFMQEIDLRIGATFTRFQTMLMKDAFVIDTVTDGRNTVLSYGPCQVCLC